MKKTIWFFMLAVLSASMIPGASLTLIQPNGGELCLGQENFQIQWTAVGIDEKIKLVLFRNDVWIASIVENLNSAGSPYFWKVGQYIGGTALAGAGYKIRIRTMSNGIDDYSDAPFALKTSSPPCLPPPPPPVLLRLESPNEGGSFVLHHDCTISWKSIAPAAVGKVQLQLYRHPCCFVGVIKENLPSTGSFTWKAGEYTGNTAPAGKYNIRVCSMADSNIFDLSDAPFNLSLMINQFKQPIALKAHETLPGIYQNYPGETTFPSNISHLPPNVTQGVWNQITPAICYTGSANHTALVGVYWFPYQNIQVAVIYRSRIHFPLSQFAGKGAQLESAKLKMKRLHSIHEDANSGCGCSENLWVLKAPMTSFSFPGIGQRIDVDLGATEFSKDITGIVKQWLDGTVANNGLLLLAGELPCSGGRTCFSCYEASLVLTMK